MINKNVADYTNFQGKTNKKIVQAPGGSSSVSLAWSNEPTHYGGQRTIKKVNHDPYSQMTNRNDPVYSPPTKQMYSGPMKVMQDPYPYQKKIYHQEPKNFQNSNNEPNIIGGEYGYNRVRQVSESSKQIPYEMEPKKVLNYNQKPQQLDIAVYEQKIQKTQRPPSVPRLPANENKACIKINGPPRHNMIFGDGNYNYWKQTNQNDSLSSKGNSQKKISYQQNQQNGYYQQPPQQIEKTSVRVKNPPGGKGSFAFG